MWGNAVYFTICIFHVLHITSYFSMEFWTQPNYEEQNEAGQSEVLPTYKTEALPLNNIVV